MDIESLKKFTSDISWVLVGSFITLVIGFFIRPILARWLGPDGLGTYTLIITIYSLVIIFSSFGIPLSLTKFVAQFKDSKSDLSKYISSGFVLSLIFGAISSLVIFLLANPLAIFFKNPAITENLIILGIAFPFASIGDTQTGILNGFRLMKRYVILVVLNQIFFAFFVILFVWLGFGVRGTIFGIIVSEIVTIIFVGFPLLKKHITYSFKDFISTSKILIPFGGKLVTNNSINQITNNVDIIIVGYFLVTSQVAYYGVATTLSNFIWFIPLTIQRITYPAISEYWHKKQHNNIQTMFDISLKFTTIILVFGGLLSFFFMKYIILILFGNDFYPSIFPFYILLIGSIIRGSLCQPIGSALTAINRPDLPLKISAFMLTCNTILNLLLIPQMGIIGAAIAASISFTVGSIITLFITVKKLKLIFNIRWYTGLLIIICLILSVFYLSNTYINLFIISFLLLIMYILIVYKFFITQKEKKIFSIVLQSLTKRS